MSNVRNVKAYAFDFIETVGKDSVIPGGFGVVVSPDDIDALMQDDRFLLAAKNLSSRLNAGESWAQVLSDEQGLTDARTIETFTGRKVGEVVVPRISQISLRHAFYRWTPGLDETDVDRLKQSVIEASEQSRRVSVDAFLGRDPSVFPEIAEEKSVSSGPTIQ